MTSRVDDPSNPAPEGALLVLPGLLAAFNRHDADAFAAFFSPNAWFINVDGLRFSGRTEIEAAHRFAFSSILAGTRLQFTGVASRSVGDAVALVEASWASDDGVTTQPVRRGIMVLLLEEDPNSHWAIVHCANGDYSDD